MRSIFLFVVFGILTLAASFFYTANADISVTLPPKDWQASPENNSTSMVWFNNSTKSYLIISKLPDSGFPLSLTAPIFAQLMAEMDILESSDQVTFAQSNFGYRYFLNLTSMTQNISSVMQNLSSTPVQIEFELADSMKMMVILTQKHGENYAVALMTPTNNFETVSNQIKPTLDSIKITKYPLDTGTKWREYNSTLGVSLEHPTNWTIKQDRDVAASDSLFDSICNSATGTCFNIITNDLNYGINDTHLDLVSRSWLNSTVNAGHGDKLLSPLQMANYTIDGEKAEVFSEVFIVPNSDVVGEKQVTMVIHNGKIYVLEFGGHFNTFSKSGEKEIGQHIIESINWTQISPTWKKYHNSSLGLSMEYPSDWDLNSTANSMCDPGTGTCFTTGLLLNESINTDFKTFIEGYQQLEAQNSSDMIEPVQGDFFI